MRRKKPYFLTQEPLGALVPPPRPGQLYPTLGKGRTYVRFPLRMTIGSRNFAVKGIPVLIFGCNQCIDRLPRGQWQLR